MIKLTQQQHHHQQNFQLAETGDPSFQISLLFRNKNKNKNRIERKKIANVNKKVLWVVQKSLEKNLSSQTFDRNFKIHILAAVARWTTA